MSAFEVAAFDQSAHVTYPGPSGSHIGSGESIPDTARVLATHVRRYRVPRRRPVQRRAMADHAGVHERTSRRALGGHRLLFPWRRPNVARSLLVTGALLGMDVRIAVPRDLWPHADQLLLLTDVPAVMEGFGTPHATPLAHLDLDELAAMEFPPGSMGPKIEACRRFVAATGCSATIGMGFSDSADLGSIAPLNDHDETVLEGIFERLKAHGKTERFGVKLIRDPLSSSTNELLLETSDCVSVPGGHDESQTDDHQIDPV